MEHRDGSGAFCHPKSPETGERESLFYIKAIDSLCVLLVLAGVFPVQPNLTLASRYSDERKYGFQREQLEQRRFEIYAAIDALKKLPVDGDREAYPLWMAGGGLVGIPREDRIRYPTANRPLFWRFYALFFLSHEPTEGPAPHPVTHALLLDPWLEPFGNPPLSRQAGTFRSGRSYFTQKGLLLCGENTWPKWSG